MYLGIDIGSISTNAVLVDGTGNILTFVISDSGYDHKHTIQKTIQTACQSIGIPDSDIKRTVSTGYGRNNVAKADKTVTEITCHAVGVHRLFPKASVGNCRGDAKRRNYCGDILFNCQTGFIACRDDSRRSGDCVNRRGGKKYGNSVFYQTKVSQSENSV